MSLCYPDHCAFTAFTAFFWLSFSLSFSLCVHCVLTVCSLCAHCTLAVCSLCAHCVLTVLWLCADQNEWFRHEPIPIPAGAAPVAVPTTAFSHPNAAKAANQFYVAPSSTPLAPPPNTIPAPNKTTPPVSAASNLNSHVGTTLTPTVCSIHWPSLFTHLLAFLW